MTKSAAHLRIIEETPAYWRAVFDNPPLSIMGARMFEGLQDLLSRMDASPSLRVVVFESANPEFYLAHFDLSDIAGSLGLMKTAGPSGLPILMDTFVHLTKSPVVSIAKIRGRARGVGSEFVLACDMRFASRENTALAQVEVGSGVHPGGGGTERLPHLVGRGRALEIVLSANDFDGETAERYGYVNRALPDVDLDGFVDALARRIGSFDRPALAAAKRLVNEVSLPSSDRLLAAFTSFGTALGWPAVQRRVGAVLARGLQSDAEFEKDWPEMLCTLGDQGHWGGVVKNRLQWEVFVSAQIPVLTNNLAPGATDMKWSPISTTLISGERDAVLVDTAITVDQNQKLVDWIVASGKNLTAIYATHGHGDHFFGVHTIQKAFPAARFVTRKEAIDVMREQASDAVVE